MHRTGKLIHAYMSDLLFVGGMLRMHNVSVLSIAPDWTVALHHKVIDAI